jgi:large subunit ribosomal protein L19
MNTLIKKFEAESRTHENSFPEFGSGDTINVSVKITEGNKERIQQFQGVVIQRKNGGSNGETFTVRKISSGIGVHRIFPFNSPSIVTIEVVRRGKVRRARLNYLKGRQGKAARIKEKIQKK